MKQLGTARLAMICAVAAVSAATDVGAQSNPRVAPESASPRCQGVCGRMGAKTNDQ
jgi:hypothetical protein